VRALVLFAVLAALVVIPQTAAAASFLPTGPLHPAGRWIEDSTGRVVIIHGLELARKSPPYYPPPASFTAQDAQNIEHWGFDAVRLAWFWKGLEPQRGQIDRTYLAQVVRDGELLAEHHVFTLLEAHQDGYNETLGGAGFPDWATITDGTWAPAESLPEMGVFDLQAARAFDNLYANTDGIAAEFAHAWAVMAAGFAHNPMMLGYDLFNEPNPGSQWESCANPVGCPAFDLATLEPLEDRLAAAVRSADPNTIVFYEPNIYFDSGAASWLAPPPPTSGPSGFAFHDYCLAAELTGQPDGESASTGYPACEPVDSHVFQNALTTAAAMGVPPLFDEFGDTQDLSQIKRVIGLADQNLTGWIYWSYKDWVDDPGGLGSGPLYDDSDDDGTLREAKLAVLEQPYPVATAGIPIADDYNPTSDTFTYTYLPNRRISAPTVIFTAPLHYPNGYTLKVSGARVTSAANARYVELQPADQATKVHVVLTPTDGVPPAPTTATASPALSPTLAPLADPAPAAVADPLGTAVGSCDENADDPATIGSPALATGHADVIAHMQLAGGSGEVTNAAGISIAFKSGDSAWVDLGSAPAGEEARASVICRAGTSDYAFTFTDAPLLPVSFTGSSTHVSNVSLANSRLGFQVPASGRYVADVSVTGGTIEVGLRRHNDTTPPASTFTGQGVEDLGTLTPGTASLDVTALGDAQAHWTITIHAGDVATSGPV
jgi:endoglycosylceramidase